MCLPLSWVQMGLSLQGNLGTLQVLTAALLNIREQAIWADPSAMLPPVSQSEGLGMLNQMRRNWEHTPTGPIGLPPGCAEQALQGPKQGSYQNVGPRLC